MKNLKKINWKHVLLDNWGLKLLSFSIAFVLWFVVITEEDPVDTKTFYGIKVDLVNTEKLVELGRVYEVLDGTDTLRSVTVEAPGSILDKMEASDIIAEADLNQISGMNTVEINFYCPAYSRDIIDIDGNISNVKLSIEDKMKKSLYIRHEELGQVADGHIMGGVTLEHTRLEVEGPASKIEQISNAVVRVDVSGAMTDFATPLAVDLVDKSGNTLLFDSVQQSVETVNVNAKVLKLKEIPIEYIPIGVPAEGYLFTGVVEASPSTAIIAGSLKELNRINKIVISEELDMTGATETLEVVIDLENNKYLNGTILYDDRFDGNARVKIYVEKEQEKDLAASTWASLWRIFIWKTKRPSGSLRQSRLTHPKGIGIPEAFHFRINEAPSTDSASFLFSKIRAFPTNTLPPAKTEALQAVPSEYRKRCEAFHFLQLCG